MEDEILNHSEPHFSNHHSRLNWLRAGVLGANDGIVSIAGLVVGVAGATNSQQAILTAGLAGIIAGAISMAAGEYVSVSSQRDTEKVLLDKEKQELTKYPKEELHELELLYRKKGLTQKTAALVAKELTEHDAFTAHANIELGIDPNVITNPWHAAFASAVSFFIGALLPMIAILLPPETVRIPITFVSVVIALGITGVISAKISDAPIFHIVLRVIIGGAFAMMVTYSIGRVFGVSGI